MKYYPEQLRGWAVLGCHENLCIEGRQLFFQPSIAVLQSLFGNLYVWMDDCAYRAMMVAFGAKNALLLIPNHPDFDLGKVKHVDRTDRYAFSALNTFGGIYGNLLVLIMDRFLTEELKH